MTGELQREDVELRKRFGSEGIAINTPKAEEMAQAEKLSRDVWAQWSKGHGAEAAQALERVQKALGR